VKLRWRRKLTLLITRGDKDSFYAWQLKNENLNQVYLYVLSWNKKKITGTIKPHTEPR